MNIHFSVKKNADLYAFSSSSSTIKRIEKKIPLGNLKMISQGSHFAIFEDLFLNSATKSEKDFLPLKTCLVLTETACSTKTLDIL